MSETAVDQDLSSPGYARSIESSWQNTQEAYSVRATQNLADITQSDTVDDYEAAAAELTRNGTYRGSFRQSANYRNWSEKVVSLSNNIQDVQLQNLTVRDENVTIVTESDFRISLKDRTRSFQTSGVRKVYGVEDPILEGIDSRNIDACTFDRVAELAYSASTQGTARGEPAIEDVNPSNEAERLLITSDVEKYAESDVDDLAGYFSVNSPSDPASYNNVYAVGGSSRPSFEPDQRVLIHQGLWKSNFFRARNSECYLPTAYQDAPAISDRIEGETRGSTPQGVFTVLNPSSGVSDIGYQRADSSGIDLVSIEGVSTGEGETWSDFRMGRGLAEGIGLSQLIE